MLFGVRSAAVACERRSSAWEADTTKVTTTGELDAAVEEVNSSDRAAYIEVVTDRYSMPPMSETMFTLTRKKFGQSFTWEEWYSEFKKGNNIAARK